MTYPVPYTWFISGRITYLNGNPFTTGIIKAFHVCNGTWSYLGESGFNEDGSYQITYSSANFQNGDPTIQHPDVKIQVFDYQGNIIWESGDLMAFESQQVFSFIIDQEQEGGSGQSGTQNPGGDNPGGDNPGGENPPQEIWKIAGTVAYDNGQLLTTGIVKAFDYYGDSNHYLSSAVIKNDGTFEISYTKDSFQRGDLDRTAPNLALCIYNLTGSLLHTFYVDYPPTMDESVSIVIPQTIPITEDNYVVYGRVVNHSGRPLKDVYVKAVCLDFVNTKNVHAFIYHALNSTAAITDENGCYEIVYSPSCLPHNIQIPSPDDPKDKISLFAKFYLKEDENSSVPVDSCPKWNYSNLVLDASRRQEINFTIDSLSTTLYSKFDELEKALKVYLTVVENETSILNKNGQPIALKEDKIQHFIDSSFKNVLPGFRERLNQEDAISYFRAYELVYRIQRYCSDLLESNKLFFYASCLFALCRKGFDSIAKLQSANRQQVQDCLLEAVSQSLITSDENEGSETNIESFVSFWENLLGRSILSEKEKVDLDACDLLSLWNDTQTLPGVIADGSSQASPENAQSPLDNRVENLLRRFYDSEADVESFLENENPSASSSSVNEQEYLRLKLVFDLKNFYENFSDGIEQTYYTIVSIVNQDSSVEPSLKVLLDFDEEQWEQLVEDISSSYKQRSKEQKLALPVTFPGTTAEEQKSLYKIKLQKLITSWLPQDALLSKFARYDEPENPEDCDPVLSKCKKIAELLRTTNWKDFSLDKISLDEFLEKRSLVIGAGSGVTNDDIKTLQRLYRLTKDYDSIVYLLRNGFTSAYQIAQESEELFIAKHHDGLETMKNAKQIYCLAAQYTSEVSLQMAKYYGSLTEQGDSLPSASRGVSQNLFAESSRNVQSNVAPARVEQPVVANWKNLFGILNKNAALKGQSVLSPSAYLMDLLDFLKGDGYNLLKIRRPDIWNLLLTKENAETSLPTIDIVVELLEFLTARKSLRQLKYNTDAKKSDSDLRAEPEFVGKVDEAYAELVSHVYPMDLPRNFHAEKMVALLKNVSLSVSDLIQSQKNPGDEYRYTTLRLSPSLIETLRLPKDGDETDENSLIPVHELWGLDNEGNSVLCPDKATVVTGAWDEILSNASIFLSRSGLTVKDFQEIRLFSIFENDNVTIEPINNTYQLGDIGAFRIENISKPFARKISRFVRLKRLLGWNNEDVSLVFDLDLKDVYGLNQDAIDGLSSQEINRLKLEAIDRVAYLKTLTSASIREILAWVDDMSDDHFDCVFPTPAESEDKEDDNGKSTEPDDGQNDVSEEKKEEFRCKLLERASVSLGVNQTDLLYALRFENESFSDGLSDDDLKENLKVLYRISTFAKRLGISVQKYEILRFLLGADLAKDWNLANLTDCFQNITDILNSPLDEDSLIYLAMPLSPVIAKKAESFVDALKESLQKLWESAKSDKQVEIERDFPDIEATPESRTAFYEWLEQEINAFANSQNMLLPNDILELCEKESLVTDDLDAIKTWLLSLLGSDYSGEVDALFTAASLNDNVWAKELVKFLAFAEAARNEILEKLTAEFGISCSVCEDLLNNRLESVKQTSSGAALFDWFGLAVIDNDSETGVMAYALLSKSALINGYTKMTDYSNIGLGNIYQSIPLNSFDADEDGWDWKNYPADENLFAESNPLSDSLRKLILCFNVSKCFGSSWIYDKLSKDFLLKKWNVNERQLKEILGFNVGADIAVPSLSDPEAWMQLCRYWKVYKKAPIDMATLQTLIADDLVGEEAIADYSDAVENLNSALRNMRTPGDWQAFITPVSDTLRKSRRDAFVSYICFRSQNQELGKFYYPKKFFDANDIYSYYLIDVEMEPDMSVSRTRQVLNSIQQFVSRVELGLEGSFVLSEEQRRNWEWMQNYRVWEANRKIFLYAENWIESDLRDDKSPFFKELEDEIRQVGNDPKAMHAALGNYLEKIYETSGVEIIGACKEDGGGDGILYTLHIVGRTRGEPHRFFIRKYKAKALYSGEWEPWENLNLDIKAEVALPVLMNQKLYVIWPSLMVSKKEDGAESEGAMQVTNQVEIRMNWAYHNGNKWSSIKTTKNVLFDKYERERDVYLEDGEKIDDRYHFQVESGSSEYVQVNVFRSSFKDISYDNPEEVEVTEGTTLKKNKVVVKRDKDEQSIQETGFIQIWVDGRDVAFTAPKKESRNVNEFPPSNCYLERNCWVEKDKHLFGYDGFGLTANKPVLQNTPGLFRVLPINFAFYSGEDLPFFYMDGQHSFLVHKVPGVNSTKYQFDLISHPLVPEFYKRYRDGGDELLFNRETQALPVSDSYYYSYSYYNYYFSVYLGYYIAGDWEAWDLGQSLFSLNYKPSAKMVARPYPVPMIDFSFGTSNAIYNWELFFHVPMLLADKMFQEQNYEEALKWYRMVFDPRLDLSDYEITKRWSRKLPKGSRFWRFLPFFANRNADDSILETISKPTEYDLLPNVISLQSLVDKWKRDPFNPHLIARYRMAAYQKYVVMKYLDNLIAWADELFTQDTMESVNEAIQLYILAAEVLGPRNIEASDCHILDAIDVKTFLTEKEGAIANVYKDIEDVLVAIRNEEQTVTQGKPSVKSNTLTNVFSSVFYFSVPRNDKLLGYWDTVADRLYKIRNSLNIDGVKRTLALYEPPIDPALLVKARAAGVSIADALSESSAPLPLYRFQVMLQKALDVTHELQSLSSAFLSALEKNDSETLSLMRSRHEQEILTLSRGLKDFQIKDFETQLESLEKNRESTVIRYEFYKNIKKISDKEQKALDLQDAAVIIDTAASALNMSASAASAIPDLNVGGIVNVFGGPEVSSNVTGGSKISSGMNSISTSMQIAANIIRHQANKIQTLAGYERRYEEWKLQEKLAEKEIQNIDKQIIAMKIRIEMTEKEISNMERQIEQMDEVYEFMTNRFTNQELYSWMVTQLGQLHSSFFKLAVKLAKRAEVCYRFELGLKDSDKTDFIKNNYWDGLRKGLLAGDRLLFDLRTMESAYQERNKRELEINRAVPLSLIDAEALIKLQTEGKCDFVLPEILFDLDFPGQTYRRIRGVQLEIHCNASSGQGVNAKLSLLSNRIRIKPINTYSEEDSTSYLPNRIGIKTIATSQAEAYAGVFNFDFRDERYLPFEGAGVDSSWRLELPTNFHQFDYESISDVILHVSYTARNGAEPSGCKNLIAKAWNVKKSAIRLSAIDSGALERLRNGEEVSINFIKEHFPAIARDEGFLKGSSVYCWFKNGRQAELTLEVQSSDVSGINSSVSFSESDIQPELWNISSDDIHVANGYSIAIKVADGSTPANIEDLIFVHKYALANSVDEEA